MISLKIKTKSSLATWQKWMLCHL